MTRQEDKRFQSYATKSKALRHDSLGHLDATSTCPGASRMDGTLFSPSRMTIDAALASRLAATRSAAVETWRSTDVMRISAELWNEGYRISSISKPMNFACRTEHLSLNIPAQSLNRDTRIELFPPPMLCGPPPMSMGNQL